MTRRIIAMGGGGFLMERRPSLLDEYFVRAAGTRSPKVARGLSAGEPRRRGDFRHLISSGKLPSGIGIDDGVAVLYEDRTIAEVVSSRTGASAYRVARASGTVVEVPLQARRLKSKSNAIH